MYGRDSQRRKVYTMEQTIPLPKYKISEKEAEKLMVRIWNAYGIKAKPPEFEVRNGNATRSCANRYGVHIAKHDLTPWVIIHEVSHSILHYFYQTDSKFACKEPAWHDGHFAGMVTFLYEHLLGVDRSTMMSIGNRLRVKFAPRADIPQPVKRLRKLKGVK